MSDIAPREIDGQAWKFYFVLLAWPLFLFLLPYAFVQCGAWSLLLMIFPGLYLFTWVGYCMHECWHKYVPTLPNDALYHLFAWMLISDPQIYRLLHGHHHAEVNTWEDREFHPLGEIKNAAWRRVYHFFEIFLGVLLLVLISAAVVPRLPRYRDKYRIGSLLLSIVVWMIFLGGLGVLAGLAFGVTWSQVALADLAMLWIGSFVLHHSQLIEHGNLIVPGDWNQRNLRTRNLRRQTWPEKLILFLTHGDSREHVLHHTLVKIYSRPFPGRVPMPPEAVVISLGDYFGILRDMLLGRPSPR